VLALTGEPEDALAALQEAIGLDARMAADASQDEDFGKLRDAASLGSRFRDLTAGPSGRS
jgi:hypothetical protein